MGIFIFPPAAAAGSGIEQYLNGDDAAYAGQGSSWVSWNGDTFTAAIEKTATDPTSLNAIAAFAYWDLSKLASQDGTVRTHLRLTSIPAGNSADLLVPSGIVLAASAPPTFGTTSRWAELTLGYSPSANLNTVGGVAAASNNSNPYNNGSQASPFESVETTVIIRGGRILRAEIVWYDTAGVSDILDLSTKTTLTGTDSLYAWVGFGFKGTGSGAAGTVEGTFHVDYTPVTTP